jgi:hypothetical protein
MPGSFSPIAEVQTGAVAYLFGILNNGTPYAITGISSFELESDEVKLNWEQKRNKDTTGNTQNITEYEFQFERTTKFNPSGATRAAAHAVGDAVFTLQLLVCTNFKNTTLNGTWRIKPGITLSLKAGDNATVDIMSERWVSAPQNAALTGTPIVG